MRYHTKIFIIGYVGLVLFSLTTQVSIAQSAEIVTFAPLQMLAPKLAINQETFKAQISKPDLLKSVFFHAKFLLHIRSFDLLCDLARVMNNQEGVSIYIKAVTIYDKNGEVEIVEFPQALHKTRKYLSTLEEFYSKFRKVNHGVIRQKEEYGFEMLFISSKGQQFRPAHLENFFKNFFLNEFTYSDGTEIDISFRADETKDLDVLPQEDIKELLRQLGYNLTLDEFWKTIKDTTSSIVDKKVPKKPVFIPDSIVDIDPIPVETGISSWDKYMIKRNTIMREKTLLFSSTVLESI